MDGARVAAEGIPLTLTDGTEVRVRYGMRALLALEREYGGLLNVAKAVSSDGSGPMVEPALTMLAAGLAGQHQPGGAPYTVDSLSDLVDLADLQPVLAAVGQALAEAFPTPPPAAEPGETGDDPSRGPTGTTSAP